MKEMESSTRRLCMYPQPRPGPDARATHPSQTLPHYPHPFESLNIAFLGWPGIGWGEGRKRPQINSGVKYHCNPSIVLSTLLQSTEQKLAGFTQQFLPQVDCEMCLETKWVPWPPQLCPLSQFYSLKRGTIVGEWRSCRREKLCAGTRWLFSFAPLSPQREGPPCQDLSLVYTTWCEKSCSFSGMTRGSPHRLESKRWDGTEWEWKGA